MSDFILKFWPKSEVSESKIEQIKNTLKANNIISEEVIHWSGNSNKATNQISKYLDYDFEDEGSYSKSLIVKISENEYGVKEGEDDIETFDRKNVISIYEGDGSIINWIKFCGLLNSITGDEYEAGWEIL